MPPTQWAVCGRLTSRRGRRPHRYLAHRDYQAVFGTAFSGAFIVAAAAGAALLDAAGGRALSGACGAFGIAAALGQLALGPAIARRTEGQ